MLHRIQQTAIKEYMGCQSSQHTTFKGPELKISILDSSFMKPEHKMIRQQMQENNITFQCYLSLDCFLDDFVKRYYNRVVTSIENYKQLKAKLQKLSLTPYIYVIMDGKILSEEKSFNTVTVENYGKLVDCLKQSARANMTSSQATPVHAVTKKVDVKILCKPGVRNSEETIFQNALKKASIQFQFYTSFQMLQQSIFQSQATFIVTDYIFHKEVVQLCKNSTTKIICYCSFQQNQTYSPDIYFVSNNYLDITNNIKAQLISPDKNYVKCSKVYLYEVGLEDFQEMKESIQQFGLQVRLFNNMEKVIKDTAYFFCVTVVAEESQAKNLAKFFQTNNYLERVKILTVKKNTQPTTKGLFKLIRDIKKGYQVKKGITHSIDIIDKHYNNTKFQQIKKQLQNNDIKCFGYNNINQFINQKKFISSFIICNFQQRQLLTKYIKHLQSKAKIIVFCNKNKITQEIKINPNYAYVSSHFGKIIKFIQKTYVFLPVLEKHDDVQLKEKINKLKLKNKRISALKWSQISLDGSEEKNQQNFQFLNIAKGTNNESIRDIQKSVAAIWKVQGSIFQLQKFKAQFILSLKQLNKIHKINFSDCQFNQLIERIKQATFAQLLQKVKTFFDADNQLGLQINKSLMKTESLEKKQIINMRQFLLLVFMNFFSGYQIPKIGVKKVSHWVSNSLIQKCQVDSYLFSKHFIIFYEDTITTMNEISKYKIELQLQYNTLAQADLLYNSFIRYKDKIIFCPFSQFQVTKIQNAGQFKVITVKFIKNVQFLKCIYEQNLLHSGLNLASLPEIMLKPQCQLVDSKTRQNLTSNLQRIKSLQLFERGQVNQAIQIHQKLIKQSEEKQNLDSMLINELNYQISSFYFKANKNREAGGVIKQLLEADPGSYIRSKCEKMIKQVVEPEVKPQTQKDVQKRRVSEQAMKQFIWLNNQQQSEEKSESDEGLIEQNQQECIFEQDLRCIQIDDLQQQIEKGPIINQVCDGKQNKI